MGGSWRSLTGERSAGLPPQPPAAPYTIKTRHSDLARPTGAQTALSVRKLIFQGHADEYGHAEVVVVEEGAKARLPIACAYQPELVNEERRARAQSGVVPITHVDHAADQVQGEQGHELQRGDDVAI